MPAPDAVKGKGTTLDFGNTADHTTATTWTNLAKVVNVKPPKKTAPKADATHLTSEVKESIPGLPEVGDAEITIQYKADRAADIEDRFNVVGSFRVLYPDGSGRKWTGFINDNGEDEIVNGEIITQTIKIASSGDYVHFASEA